MIEATKRVQQRILEKGDETMLYPINHLISGNELNLKVCSFVNRRFFYCDKRILIKVLSLNLKYIGFTRYYKPKKFDSTKFDFVVSLLKKKYFMGPNDILSARKVIQKLISDKKKLSELSEQFGLNNKERKILGIEAIKFDKTLIKKVKTKSLMEW